MKIPDEFEEIVRQKAQLYGIEYSNDLWEFAHSMYDLGWKDRGDLVAKAQEDRRE